MKRSIMAVIALATCLAPLAAAQEAERPAQREVVPASENAALRYWEAAWQLAPRDLPTQCLFIDFDEINSEQANAKLVAVQEEIELLLTATRLHRCDFGVPRDWATGDSFPHVTMVRQGAQTLLWDAERLASVGEFDEAARRIAGVLRISEHLGQNVQSRVENLVSLSLSFEAYSFTKKYEEDFDSSQRDEIARALRRFRTSDPFRTVDSIVGESAASMRWWVNLRESEEFGPPDLEDIKRGFGYLLSDRLSELKSYEAQVDELNREFEAEEQFWQKVAAALMQPDAEEAITRIAEDAENMKYGILASTWDIESLWISHKSSVQHLTALRAWASGETETLELPEENTR